LEALISLATLLHGNSEHELEYLLDFWGLLFCEFSYALEFGLQLLQHRHLRWTTWASIAT